MKKNKLMTLEIIELSALSVVILALVIIGIRVYFNNNSDSTNFYTGRENEDYSDTAFDFEGYLKSVGATDIVVSTPVGVNMETHLCFKLNGDIYDIATGVYPVQLPDDDYAGKSGAWCVVSMLSLEQGNKQYTLSPSQNNTIGLVSDTKSPFFITKDVFDTFHILTSPDGSFYYMTDGDCPFRSLGIGHYEKNGEEVTWHGDAGEPRYDLHF